MADKDEEDRGSPTAEGAGVDAATVDEAPAGKPGKGSGAKSAKDSKSKPAKATEGGEESTAPSIAGHPRASRSVARAKAWAALAGFFLGGYSSLSSGTVAEALFRALVAGLVCYVAVWAGAVFVWRRLVMLELRAHEQSVGPTPPAALPAGEETATRAGLRGAA